jgi:hypothetical protein
MHLARALQLDAACADDLFDALLLEDAGCSSNAGRVFRLVWRTGARGQAGGMAARLAALQRADRVRERGQRPRPYWDQLSTAARVLVVADVIDALASARPYREALTAESVQEVLQAERGAGFCPDVVDAAAGVIADRPREPTIPHVDGGPSS